MILKGIQADHRLGDENLDVSVQFVIPHSELAWERVNTLGEVIEGHLHGRTRSRWRRVLDALR